MIVTDFYFLEFSSAHWQNTLPIGKVHWHSLNSVCSCVTNTLKLVYMHKHEEVS